MTSSTTLALTVFVSMLAFIANAQDASSSGDQKKVDPLQKIKDGSFAPKQYHVTSSDSTEVRLKKQRINCIYAEIKGVRKRIEAGTDSVGPFLDCLKRLGEARLELHDLPKERIQVMSDLLESAIEIEDSMVTRMEAGVLRVDQAYQAAAFRLEVELQLHTLKSSVEASRSSD